ncbi:MAG: hypothetical protein ACRD0G_00020 [Acidimicrobiales bacterium]
MCGCLVVLLGAFTPRLALVVIALINDEISESFDGGILLPFVGFLFLPYTTLTYVLFHWWGDGVSGIEWFFVALAFLVDISSYAGNWFRRQDVRGLRRA